MLQYLCLIEKEKAKVRAKKQSASPESNQIDTIEMWKKKYKFTNSNLEMQKGFREGLLKMLKSYRYLQKSALKADKDDLNNFRNDLKSSESPLKNFENASEREIKSQDFNEDLNENQLETEWVWLRSKKVQQRLSQHIICDYAQKENFYSESFSFFKSVVCSFQNFDLWIKKMWEKTKAETCLKEY